MKAGKRIALSVFIIAFCFGLNITGISPVLGLLNVKYAEYGTSTVQLLQTLPYLFVMVGSLMLGWLTTKVTKKKIVQTGLLVVGVCGVLPFFIDSFEVLFAARLFIGIGFGVVGPINTAIIADFFKPEERAGYLGLHVVGMGIGTMAGNLIGGVLAGIDYRFFYLVYGIAFAAAALVTLLLIETPVQKAEKASDMKLTGMVYVLSLISLVHTLFINAYNTNIGIYILDSVTENPTATGVATADSAAAALIVGMTFGKISGFLKNYTLPFSILSAAAGYAAIFFIPGMAGVYAASVLCGVSLSCFNAISAYLVSISVEKNAVAKASGMLSIVGGIGGLVAPIILGSSATVLFHENTAWNQFIIAFAGMLIFGICVLIFIQKQTKEK